MKTFNDWLKENNGSSPFLNDDEWKPARSSHATAFAKKVNGGYLVASDAKGSHQAFISDFQFNNHWKLD